MSQIEVVSVELQNYQNALPQWADALSTRVGRVTPSARDQELTLCVPTSLQMFSGRIEAGALGNIVLAKLAATPNHFSRSLRTLTPSLPVPVLLLIQLCGSSRVDQHDRSCIIRPGEWCLVDTLHPFDGWSLATRNEYLAVGLERPSDPEVLRLLKRGVARCWHAKTGISRILQATLTEAFDQMSCLGSSSGRALQRAVTEMVWNALQEQLEASSYVSYQDLQRARIKTYIESQLVDPDLSVDAIAQACGMSVRSLHRAFKADPAGSVSNYIWMRRLNRSAGTLRDPRHADQSITEICFSWGFNSTSHFSRMFKEHFGVPPRDYRVGFTKAPATQTMVA